MFHAAGLGHGSRDVNDRRESFDRCRSANLRHVVHTVLHAEDQRAGSEQRSQRARRRCVVCCLHTKKDNFRASNRA